MAAPGRILRQFSGDPNGSETAPIGTLGWDNTNNVLYTNDDGATSWTVAGAVIVGSLVWTPLTPANIVANQNNYDPGDGTIVRLNPVGGDFDITGLAPAGGNLNGRVMLLQNISTLNDATLKDQDGASLVANQFLTGVGDITLSPGDAALFWYDGVTTKWRAALGI